MAAELAVDVTRIGSIIEGSGLEVEGGETLGLNIADGGYRHFP
jgi:hypothetical protein